MVDYLKLVRTRLGNLLHTDDPRGRRVLALIRGSFSSLGNKALGMLIALISVPLTITYLGTERYGAWVAIGSLLAWFSLTDFGLGPGLTNAITADASRDRSDLVRMHLSNFIFLMGLIGLLVGALIALAWPFIDWKGFFGIADPGTASELHLALIISFSILLLRLPISISNRVYMAYQQGHIANYWAAAGNIFSLASLILVTQTKGGLPWLVFALSGTGLIVELICVLWLFLYRMPHISPSYKHINRFEFKSIYNTGIKFFIITIMALVTFQTDILVIAHYMGAAAVPNYSVTYAFFNYANLPQVLMFPYLWTAYSEAIARGDSIWVRRVFNLNIYAGVSFTALVVLLLLVIGGPFIQWWTNNHVNPSFNLMCAMGAWVIINAFTNPISCLLAASSTLKWQIVYSGFATVANLVLSIILVPKIGAIGAILSTVFAYSLFVCGPIYIDAKILLRRLSSRSLLHDAGAT